MSRSTILAISLSLVVISAPAGATPELLGFGTLGRPTVVVYAPVIQINLLFLRSLIPVDFAASMFDNAGLSVTPADSGSTFIFNQSTEPLPGFFDSAVGMLTNGWRGDFFILSLDADGQGGFITTEQRLFSLTESDFAGSTITEIQLRLDSLSEIGPCTHDTPPIGGPSAIGCVEISTTVSVFGVPVPEPSAALTFGIGTLVVGSAARRRNN